VDGVLSRRRPVVNVIQSTIVFEGGRIVSHADRFSFPAWAAQALGMPGRLFGRFEWFRRLVARKALRGLGLAPSPAPPAS
jgi:hypothetical protein